MRELLLGIDIGTSACKVAIFDRGGNVISQSNKSYKVYYPRENWAEQDPEHWWGAICKAIEECIAIGEVDSKDIVGIGLDGQGWAAIPVDKDRNVLDKTPIWLDTRSESINDDLIDRIGNDRVFDINGNVFRPAHITPKILWFKYDRPEIYKKTWKFLQSNSYIGMKLTGAVSQDKCQSYGVHFFDATTMKYDEALAEEIGVDIDKMPELYDCHEIIGRVTWEAAAQTGLMEGTPVVAGGLDAACGTLGCGVYEPGETQIQGGQAGGMSICEDKPVSDKRLIFGPHVVPNRWLLQGGTVGGGGVLKWIREQFDPDKSFNDLTQLASKVPPGSDDVLFFPYMAGERCPLWNPKAKGVFYGISFDKTKAHIIRAALEGVVFSVVHNFEVARQSGVDIENLDLRAMGGIANSEFWVQIFADTLGMPIKVPSSDTATTLGAVLLAGVGIGLYPSFERAVKETVKITRVQEPIPENREIYKKSMENYLRLYESLKDTFI